jgi:hypothetical protein
LTSGEKAEKAGKKRDRSEFSFYQGPFYLLKTQEKQHKNQKKSEKPCKSVSKESVKSVKSVIKKLLVPSSLREAPSVKRSGMPFWRLIRFP